MTRVGPGFKAVASTAVLLALGGNAQAACQDDWVCIDNIDAGDTVELRARNLRDFPVTYTLEVSPGSWQVDGATTVTRTLYPQQSAAVMTLHPGDQDAVDDYAFEFDWAVGVYDTNHDDEYLYALPYTPGQSFRIMQGFGSRFSHAGIEAYAIDFEMPTGTPVHAARSGVVARVEESHTRGCFDTGCGRYANFIVILHTDGTTGEYYHLQQDGVFITAGDSIARGQVIGLSGNTGYSMSPHLHFAVYRASDAGDTQSVPIRFQTAGGVVSRPRSGGIYKAALR